MRNFLKRLEDLLHTPREHGRMVIGADPEVRPLHEQWEAFLEKWERVLSDSAAQLMADMQEERIFRWYTVGIQQYARLDPADGEDGMAYFSRVAFVTSAPGRH